MAPTNQEKSNKKGFAARVKTLFKKSSKSPLPEQQVVSQTQHYASQPRSATHLYEPPLPPDHDLMERHLARIAHFYDLPQVQTYPNVDGQVVRVAHGSHTNLENIAPFRQPSSETKDTWERSTALTGANTSRTTSGKRLTVLMEDEVARPSSSAGQVGILNRLKGFEQPAQDFTIQDSRRHASGLARALREREEVEDEDSGDEYEIDEASSIIRWRGRTTVDDYYQTGTSSRQEMPRQSRARSASNQDNVNSWSQKFTIRRVSSSSDANENYTLQGAQGYAYQVQKARSISPATESVYSKDEDGIPIRTESPIQSLHHKRQRPGKSPQASNTPQTNVDQRSKNTTDGVNRTGVSIVDYYNSESSHSIAQSSSSSPTVLNLSYPRDNGNEDVPFHGVTNERLQHVPPQFNLREYIAAQRSLDAQEAKRQPSLAQLREQIRNEDAAQLAAARMQPEIPQARSISPHASAKKERTNIESPYPPWSSEIGDLYGTVEPEARQNVSPTAQVLTLQDVNQSQASLTSTLEKDAVDSEGKLHSRRPRQELEGIMHAHGLRRRSRSNLTSLRRNPVQDSFLQEQEGNVWASRGPSREVGSENRAPHKKTSVSGRREDGSFF